MTKLWCLSRGGVCAGLVVTDDVVTEAAPILRRWALGRPWAEVRRAAIRDGWHGLPVPS